MVLTTAIRKGVDPDRTTYVSKPLNLNVPGYGPWQVKTYDGTYGGSMNLVRATLASDNTVYAQLIIDLGPKAVRETAKLMGIETKLDACPPRASAACGSASRRSRWPTPTPRSRRAASATRPKAIRKVVFPDGKSDDLGKPEAQARVHRRARPTRSPRSSSRT